MIKFPFEGLKKEFDVQLELNEKELRRLPKEDFFLVANDMSPVFREQITREFMQLIKKDKFSVRDEHNVLDPDSTESTKEAKQDLIYFLPAMILSLAELACIPCAPRRVRGCQRDRSACDPAVIV